MGSRWRCFALRICISPDCLWHLPKLLTQPKRFYRLFSSPNWSGGGDGSGGRQSRARIFVDDVVRAKGTMGDEKGGGAAAGQWVNTIVVVVCSMSARWESHGKIEGGRENRELYKLFVRIVDSIFLRVFSFQQTKNKVCDGRCNFLRSRPPFFVLFVFVFVWFWEGGATVLLLNTHTNAKYDGKKMMCNLRAHADWMDGARFSEGRGVR